MKELSRRIRQEAEYGRKTRAVIQFNRDKRAMKYVQRIKEKTVISKRFISTLGPWSFAMLKVVAKSPSKTIQEGLRKIIGMEITAEQACKIFTLSPSYNRISEMNYGKSAPQTYKEKDKRIMKPIKLAAACKPAPITRQMNTKKALDNSLFKVFSKFTVRMQKEIRIRSPRELELQLPEGLF